MPISVLNAPELFFQFPFGVPLLCSNNIRSPDFQPFFDDTFIVLCGDALIDLDLTKAVEWHRQKGSIATIIMKTVPKEEVSSYGVVVTDDEGRVQTFQEKPSVDEALSNTINTGIYIFEPEVLDFIPSNTTFDIGSELFPLLVEKDAPFYATSMDFQWVDIGRVPDYWRAIRGVLEGDIKNVRIPGHEVRPGVRSQKGPRERNGAKHDRGCGIEFPLCP